MIKRIGKFRVEAYITPEIAIMPFNKNRKDFLPNLSASTPSNKLLIAAMKADAVKRKTMVRGGTPS